MNTQQNTRTKTHAKANDYTNTLVHSTSSKEKQKSLETLFQCIVNTMLIDCTKKKQQI